ncbi:MAG TPA: hypothetical protein P5572_11390 [Phycisphaerae bacterium]|nr:hypothetical protein [Phycisphaerae bacterium]
MRRSTGTRSSSTFVAPRRSAPTRSYVSPRSSNQQRTFTNRTPSSTYTAPRSIDSRSTTITRPTYGRSTPSVSSRSSFNNRSSVSTRSATPRVSRRSFFVTRDNASNYGRGSIGGIDAVATREPDSGRRGPSTYGRSGTRRSAPPVRRGGSALSFSSSLPGSYFSAYNRPEYDSGRIDWYRRNNYPSPAFGVGYGFNDLGVGSRSTLGVWGIGRSYGRGRHHDHDRGSSWSLGFSYYGGRSNCWPYGLGAYGHRHHFKSWCYPQTTTYVTGWGYPWYNTYSWGYPYSTGYGLWDDADINYDSTYVTNNYYDTDYYDGTTSQSGITAYPQSTTSVPAATPQAPQAQDHDRLGLQAFAQGDYDLARREFVRAILATPESPELIMLYGYAHFATGDYLIASMAIRRATEADPTLIESPIDLAGLYGNPADYQQHLAKLDAYVAANPTDLDAKYVSGFARYASGDPNGAGAIFAECMTAAPDDSTYFIMRDAALRASVAQQGAERAAVDEAIRSSTPSSAPE